MSNKNEPLWVYLKAFDEGKTVQYQEPTRDWHNNVSEQDIIGDYQMGYKLRVKPEQTEAEPCPEAPKQEPDWEKVMSEIGHVLNCNSVDNWCDSNDFSLAHNIVSHLRGSSNEEYKEPQLLTPEDLAGKWVLIEDDDQEWYLVTGVCDKVWYGGLRRTVDELHRGEVAKGWSDKPGGTLYDFYGNVVEKQDHE